MHIFLITYLFIIFLLHTNIPTIMTAIKYPMTTNISPQWRVVSTSSTAMLLNRQIVYTGTHLRQVEIQGTSQNV